MPVLPVDCLLPIIVLPLVRWRLELFTQPLAPFPDDLLPGVGDC